MGLGIGEKNESFQPHLIYVEIHEFVCSLKMLFFHQANRSILFLIKAITSLL